jgi:hypothetical protein
MEASCNEILVLVTADNSLCKCKVRAFKRRQYATKAFLSFDSPGIICNGMTAVDNMCVASKDA